MCVIRTAREPQSYIAYGVHIKSTKNFRTRRLVRSLSLEPRNTKKDSRMLNHIKANRTPISFATAFNRWHLWETFYDSYVLYTHPMYTCERRRLQSALSNRRYLYVKCDIVLRPYFSLLVLVSIPADFIECDWVK